MCVCQHSNVPTLTSPPVFKLLDSQGYVWLPYDLAKVIKLIGVTFKQKLGFFFQKNTLSQCFQCTNKFLEFGIRILNLFTVCEKSDFHKDPLFDMYFSMILRPSELMTSFLL